MPQFTQSNAAFTSLRKLVKFFKPNFQNMKFNYFYVIGFKHGLIKFLINMHFIEKDIFFISSYERTFYQVLQSLKSSVRFV